MKHEINRHSIKQLLDKSSARISPKTAEKLREARLRALAHQKSHQSVPVLAWLGYHGGHSHHSPRAVQWVAGLLFLACLISGAAYWQNYVSDRDVSDVDIAILTDDTPLDAYVE